MKPSFNKKLLDEFDSRYLELILGLQSSEVTLSFEKIYLKNRREIAPDVFIFPLE
jgi:hypothetical protein